MNYAIILAGGIGARFWPLSKESEPKQFLNLCFNRPMVEETISRLGSLIKKENIYIATNKLYFKKIKECAERFNIPIKNLLLEPEGKNTLAPIAILSERIKKIDPEAIIVVLPCDHFIKEKNKFIRLLNRAIAVARDGWIVTLGIRPKRPETGYGYIKIKSKIKNFYFVDRFVEKPDVLRAKKFLKDKRYYWNNGIFIFRADVMLGQIRKFAPQVYKIIIRIKNVKDLNRLWPRMPAISVDYAVMEKTKRAVLLPAQYTWQDLGSWQTLDQMYKKDKDGNIFIGNCVDMDSRNIIIWSKARLVATLGLESIIIVDTKDALLVCSKDRAQDVKKLVKILEKRKKFKKQL